MALAETPAYIEPTEGDIERITDEAQNGRSGEVLDFVVMYLVDHCTDDFAWDDRGDIAEFIETTRPDGA